MKREIEFRGMRVGTTEWVYGSAMIWNGCAQIIKHHHKLNSLWVVDQHEVIPSTIGQYTGLTDKNGVKIFEGDILESDDYTYEAVEFSEYVIGKDSWDMNIKVICWNMPYHDGSGTCPILSDDMDSYGQKANRLRVIKNIHQEDK